MPALQFFRTLFLLPVLLPALAVCGQNQECRAGDLVEWEASLQTNAGSGDFAPHYISSLRHGRLTQSRGAIAGAGIRKDVDRGCRFGWGAGAELLGGIATATDYRHWSGDGSDGVSRMRPGAIRIQQLYAEVKWRSLFIEAGMRERGSALLNDSLTSGDLVESGNARPIPQLRAGFRDFQAVPLTGGFLEIQGELGYGKFTDGAWMRRFYSHGSYHLNEGAYYLYRRLYFRTDPRKALSLTFGMQAAGEIGGITRYYERGKVVRERSLKASVWDMIKMIAPVGGEKSGVGEYMDGNNLGSWDVHARFRLPWGGDVLKAYLQKPWEKGSSLGWKNGFDGLWGIEYDFNSMGGIVSGAVVEYIDFMNQSGAIHYAPHDRPGSTITTDVSGGDQYYNNSEYNSYTNYGLGIGTPFLVSPRYNRDGYPAYIDNRVRGFHAAVAGRPLQLWDYRVAFSYKRGYGDGRQPKATVSDGVSWLAEVSHAVARVEGLRIKFQMAMDRGSMPGDALGVALSVVYRGAFRIRE